jgi:hypothetical protein
MSRQLAGSLVALAVGLAGPARADEPTPAPDATPDAVELDPALPLGAEPTPGSTEASPPASSPSPSEAPTDASGWTDQGIGAQLGAAFGGRVTPGGIRITGTYLYRLSATDWFDGAAAFTIGAGTAACFRDRANERVCDHGAFDGFATDFVAAVRRTWPSKQRFSPFVRVGAGLRLVRFSEDQTAGLAVPLIGGGGVTAELSPTMRIVGDAQLELGGGLFSRGVDTAPQLGLSIGVGIEMALR